MPDETSRMITKYVQQERERIKKETEDHYRKKAEENGQFVPPPDTRSWEEKSYVENDKPYTIDNYTATIWYIIIMVIGAIFNDRLPIWILATIIWWRHINRKTIRQKEWDKKHKGEKSNEFHY